MELVQSKKAYLALALAAGLFSVSTAANASAVQILPGLGYSDPAMLFMTEHGQFILDGDFGNPNFTFTGTTAASRGTIGQANSSQLNFLPSGMFAYRINPKLVLGLVFSSPILADIDWGPNSFVQFSSTKTLDRTLDISPKLSVQVEPNFSIGAGLDIEKTYVYNANFIPAPQLGNMVGSANGTQVGFDLGLAYKFKRDVLDLTYYSERPQFLSGYSHTQNGIYNPNYNTPLYAPWILSLDLVHFFSQKFLAWGTVYYSDWNMSYLNFNNTAVGSLSLPIFYNPTWSFLLGGQYNFYKNWSFILAGFFETKAGPYQFNLVGYPVGNVLSGTAGFSYQVNKKLSARLLYTRGGFLPNSPVNGALGDFGNMAFGVNVLGLQLSYKW